MTNKIKSEIEIKFLFSRAASALSRSASVRQRGLSTDRATPDFQTSTVMNLVTLNFGLSFFISILIACCRWQFTTSLQRKSTKSSWRWVRGCQKVNSCFTFCICIGRPRGDVYSQQGNGTGRDLITFLLRYETLKHSTFKYYNQVKYIGHTDFAAGIWIGLELRNPKGKKTLWLLVSHHIHSLNSKDIPETGFVSI